MKKEKRIIHWEFDALNTRPQLMVTTTLEAKYSISLCAMPLKIRKGDLFAQGHTGSKNQSWIWTPVDLASKSILFTASYIVSWNKIWTEK